MTTRHLALGSFAAFIASILSGCGPSGPTITVLGPKNATMIMHIQGDALRNHPDLKPMVEASNRMSQKQKPPFDPMSLTEMHVSLCPKPGANPMGDPFEACTVLKFRTPADATAAVNAAKGLADAEHAGKKYKRSTQGFMSFYQPDPQTVVSGSETIIKSYIESSTPPSQLTDAINRSTIKGQIRLAYAPGNERAQLASFKQPPFSQMIPPPLFRLLDVPNQVSLLTMSLHVSGDEFLRIELDTSLGGNAPTDVKDRLDGALSFARDTVNALMDVQLQSMPIPPDQKALAKPMVNETLGKLKVTAEGSRVVVALPVSPELAKMMRDNSAKIVKTLEDAQKGATTSATRIRNRNVLQQLGLSAHSYASGFRKLPDDIKDPSGKPLLSWRVVILPFCEGTQLHDQIDKKQPWNSPLNSALCSNIPSVYQMDGAPAAGGIPPTNYFRFVGPGTVFDGVKPPSLDNIKDGTSNTILYVQAGPSKAVPWSQPADLPFDPRDPIRALGDIPPAGFQVVMCDGSARTIPASVNPQALAAAICPNDGVPINWSPTGEPTVAPGTVIHINAGGTNPNATIPVQPSIPVPPSIPVQPTIPVQPMPPASGGTTISATLYFANNDDKRPVYVLLNGKEWPVATGKRYAKHGAKFTNLQFKPSDVIVAQTGDSGNGELAWVLVDSTGKILTYSKVGLPIHLPTPEAADFAIGKPGRSVPSAKGFAGLATQEVQREAKVALPGDFSAIWAPKQNEPGVTVRVYPPE